MIHSHPLKKLLCLGLPAFAFSYLPVIPDAHAGPSYGGISSIAEREIARRLERVKEAEADVAEGDLLWKEKDYEGARAKYRTAVDKIPDAPLVQEQRREAIQKMADVSVLLADQKAREGARDEARLMLEEILQDDIDPYNKDAKKILVRLDDPEWYNHALTPKHVENVAEVERLLKVGKGYYDLGDWDEAELQYDQVLRIDPYNQAARRGHLNLENQRRKYLDAARDHTRALLLRKVDQAWETPVPELVFNPNANLDQDNTGGRAFIQRKLRETIIPSIRFDEATVEEAVQYLRTMSQKHDPLEPGVGVNIVINNTAGPGDAGAAAAPIDATITLDLSDVPLSDALQYVADGANMKYKVEPIAVVLVPGWIDSDELYLRTFRVPPHFLSFGGGDGGGAAVADDPFADAAAGAGPALARPKTATEILGMQGVTFPDGASAFFNPGNASLVVRNTQSNMELIEVFVQNMVDGVTNQVYITTKFVEVSQQNLDELGFDWLIGQANVPASDRVFVGGGSTGNQRNGELSSGDYTFVPPGGAQPVPTGQFPVTAGLRFGLDAIQSNAIDALINEQQITSRITPGVFGVGGVLTDPQFQVVMRALNQRKGTDLMTAPSVVTRSGQRAKIEIIREFIYPTEFDPPEIPQEFGAVNLGGGGGGGNGFNGFGSANSFPVTPANPTAFEMRPVGVTLEVDPVVGSDNLTIELNIAPEVVEFEGFINYGSPIQTSAVDALGQPTTVVLTENRIEQPVFSTRKLTTAVTIWDGQTVAIGGLIREDVQHVEDKVPIFGDIPLIGRFFRTNSENHFKRNLMIFVTATIIDPAGQPTRGRTEGGIVDAPPEILSSMGGPSSALLDG